MRVALAYHHYHLGGSLTRGLVLVSRGLVAEGVDVHVYTNPETRGTEPDGVTFHDVRPTLVSNGRVGHAVECGTFAARATRALRADRDRYDIVEVVGTAGWEHDVVLVHAVVAAEQHRWPRLGGRHRRAARARAALAPVLQPAVGVARATQRRQFRPGAFTRAVAVAETVRVDLHDRFGIPLEQIDVVPPPIAGGPAAANGDGRRVRDGLGLRSDDFMALFIGHDFERKGLDVAIAALARLDRPVHLAVVGNGPVGRFRAEAERQGVEGQVHFAGPTDEPEAFFRAADVFVLPTLEDVWGTVLLEAMAAGLPVVTSSAAGASVAVRSAGAGLVVDSISADTLADALGAAVADPEARRNMGRRGRRAAEGYSEQAIARAKLRIYEQIVAERRERG